MAILAVEITALANIEVDVPSLSWDSLHTYKATGPDATIKYNKSSFTDAALANTKNILIEQVCEIIEPFHDANFYRLIKEEDCGTDNASVVIDSTGNVLDVQLYDGFSLFASYSGITSSLGAKGFTLKNESVTPHAIANYTLGAFRFDGASNYVNSFTINTSAATDTATVNTKKCNSPGAITGNLDADFTITNNNNNTTLIVNDTMNPAILTLNGTGTGPATVNCDQANQTVSNTSTHNPVTANMNPGCGTLGFTNTTAATGDTTANMESASQQLDFTHSGGGTLDVNMNQGSQILKLGGTASGAAAITTKISSGSSIELNHTTNNRKIIIDTSVHSAALDLIANSAKLNQISNTSNQLQTLNLLFKGTGDVELFDFFPTTLLTLSNDGNNGTLVNTILSNLGNAEATFNFGINPLKTFLSRINLLLNYNNNTTKTLKFDTFPVSGIFIKNEANNDKTITVNIPTGSYKITKNGTNVEYEVVTSPMIKVSDYTFTVGNTVLIEYGAEPKSQPQPPIQVLEEELNKGPEEILIPQDAYETIIDSLPSVYHVDIFHAMNGSGLDYTIYENYVAEDGRLLKAFKTLTVAQLQELMAISSVEGRINYLENIAKIMSFKSKNSNIYNKNKPISFKEKTSELLNSFDQYHISAYNSLSVDIRNLFQYNNIALKKFQSLSKQDIFSFTKISPIDQLNFVLSNFQITYVKKNMQAFVEQKTNVLNSKNQINGKNKDKKQSFIFIK